MLRRVTEHLSGEHTLEYAFQEVTDAALELLAGDHASLRVVDASRRGVNIAKAQGGNKVARAMVLGLDEEPP